MWNQLKLGILGGCCLAMLSIGAIGCHHDHDDYDNSRQSGYYQDRTGYDRHYDYDHNRGDYDRHDYDRHDYDRHY